MKKRSVIQNAAIKHITEHSSLYVFVTVLFLMGVIFGAILVNSLSPAQKDDLFYYLSQFFGQVSQGKIAANQDMFFQSLTHNIKYIAVIWILGISVIGLPVILILLFLKGMVVGFTVGFLVNQMGWNGFLLSFVSILPQNIFIVPIFIIIASLAVSISMKMIRRIFLKQIRDPLKPIFTRYIFSLAFSMFFLIAAGILEAYLSPPLMKNVVSLLNK
ncbi:stage II sporulation protein M [Actinomycetes bacterium NPDC127524]|uniref:stage II sporulation protein M n=1 Tax=unclassified Bacillus (in: firmicutes) TaxID=185979 RepID=UPI0008E52188|nr:MULTISPECIES: stage II sporulation protein M [unclassified Bacillus (in: firmicutes)]OIK13637.1 stage II sporulation protein M [Bacillus sp. MUM 13]SFC43281.1 stage II sporulation protein M [Bacillus sp. OV322]